MKYAAVFFFFKIYFSQSLAKARLFPM